MNTKKFDLTGFDKVDVKGAFEFEIRQADAFAVTVDEAWFKHARVYVERGRLIVYHPWYDVSSWFTPWIRPSVNIHMPALSELKVSGACHGSVGGFQSTDSIRITVQGASSLSGEVAGAASELRVEGASRMDLSLKANNVRLRLLGASRFGGTIEAQTGDIEVAGASRLGLSGTLSEGRFNVAGASRLDLENLLVHNANVRLVGASRSELRVDGKLDAELAGASRLVYDGNPVMGRVSTVGASSLSKK